MPKLAESAKRRIGISLVLSAGLIAAANGAAWGQSSDVVKISFGLVVAAPSHTPLWAGIGEGFFKKEGLEVSVQLLSGGGPTAMAAMATGSINMMAAGSAELIDYMSKKVISGKIVGESQDSSYDLIVSKDITSIAQLKGKTLAISGPKGQDQVWMNAVLQKYGVFERDVTYLTTGNALNRVTALGAGAVQAIAVTNADRATNEKVGTVIVKSADSPVKIPNTVIFANSDLVTKNKEAVKKFLKVAGETTAWIKANPAAAVAYCMKGSGSSSESCTNAIKGLSDPVFSGKYTWSSTWAVDPEGMREALALVNTLTPESKSLKLEDIIDTSFAPPPG